MRIWPKELTSAATLSSASICLYLESEILKYQRVRFRGSHAELSISSAFSSPTENFPLPMKNSFVGMADFKEGFWKSPL